MTYEEVISCQLVHLLKIVAGYENRFTLIFVKMRKDFSYFDYPHRIQAVCRLVQDQQLRIAQQRYGQIETPPHSH